MHCLKGKHSENAQSTPKITGNIFILNIFIALRYTYTTPVVTGSKNQGLGEDDRTPPVGYGHLGI
jgi:hypothetical protein